MRFDFRKHDISMANLTRPMVNEHGTQFDHPHVRSHEPCWGNIRQPVMDLLANRKLWPLVPLTLDFLRSYNSSNPHWSIRAWQ